jgi:hypothetical protein
MKSRYSRLLAGLLTIGILGAYGSNAAATIENSISDAQAAAIGRIAEINNFQEIGISNGIAAESAIARTIGAYDIKRISDSVISDISLIAIANTIEENIQGNQIYAEITEIAA